MSWDRCQEGPLHIDLWTKECVIEQSLYEILTNEECVKALQ